MDATDGLGYLVIVAGGEPHLLPMEFSLVDGEWWGGTSEAARAYAGIRGGQVAEVLLLDAPGAHDRVRGVVSYSTDPADRQRLWDLQWAELQHWFHGADDPTLVVVRLLPEGQPLARPRFDDAADDLPWAA